MLSVNTAIVTIMTKFGVHIHTFPVAGAAKIGEQVASKRATCRGYYSCRTVLLLYCSLLHYKSVMSGFLSTWMYFQEPMVLWQIACILLTLAPQCLTFT